jgi:hypothetical protein
MTSNTLFLIVAILSVASAFNNKASVRSMASVSVLDAHTARPSLRSCSTGMYGSRARSLPSPSSFSRTRQQQASTWTRLQFSDNASPDTTIESSWWRKLFTVSSPSMNPSSTITSSSSDTSSLGENKEQENVDAYLEFLDKRYRRLHSDDKEEEQAKSKQQDSSASKKRKSFSAMDWLANGGSNNSDIVSSTTEQQEDALYVLGVAGLASQKLLQKHHLPSTTNPSPTFTMEKVVELQEQIDDAIEINDDTKSLKTKMNHFLLNNFLLPIVRVIYLAQRCKQLFLKMVQRKVTAIATKATDGLVNTFSKGPKSVLNGVLTLGGGKQNVLRTVAIGYATIVVFRPLLNAVLAEGLAFDQLIK